MDRRVVVRSGGLLLLNIFAGAYYLKQAYPSDPWAKKAQIESPKRMSDLGRAPNNVPGWPPEVGKPFPQVALLDHEGQPFDVRAWRGKPTLIEIATMTCAGCQAFSGGDTRGAFGGMPVQQGLASIEHYFQEYTGQKLFSDKIHFAQILIYNLRLDPVEPGEAAMWREHFGFDRYPDVKILTGGAPLANRASFRMIPGFLLLDEHGTVLFDATGHSPKHGLYTELLPAAKTLLAQR